MSGVLDLSPLRPWLESLAGSAMSFHDLARQALHRGYKETHLRTTLTALAQDGLAIREEPLDYSRTPWPTDSKIRFYQPPG
jgi:hypothetical protein